MVKPVQRIATRIGLSGMRTTVPRKGL